MELVDGSVEPIDAIIYATGYKITFPFFDKDFISAPENVLPLFKRVFKPGIGNLMLIGFAQAIPSLIAFVQDQAQWVAAYLDGEAANALSARVNFPLDLRGESRDAICM